MITYLKGPRKYFPLSHTFYIGNSYLIVTAGQNWDWGTKQILKLQDIKKAKKLNESSPFSSMLYAMICPILFMSPIITLMDMIKMIQVVWILSSEKHMLQDTYLAYGNLLRAHMP